MYTHIYIYIYIYIFVSPPARRAGGAALRPGADARFRVPAIIIIMIIIINYTTNSSNDNSNHRRARPYHLMIYTGIDNYYNDMSIMIMIVYGARHFYHIMLCYMILHYIMFMSYYVILHYVIL